MVLMWDMVLRFRRREVTFGRTAEYSERSGLDDREE